jgi:hypothetical protein
MSDKAENVRLKNFIHELLDHLGYCGWGDRWEREVSEDLRKKAEKFQKDNPK